MHSKEAYKGYSYRRGQERKNRLSGSDAKAKSVLESLKSTKKLEVLGMPEITKRLATTKGGNLSSEEARSELGARRVGRSLIDWGAHATTRIRTTAVVRRCKAPKSEFSRRRGAMLLVKCIFPIPP
jgi:hypothetical protein